MGEGNEVEAGVAQTSLGRRSKRDSVSTYTLPCVLGAFDMKRNKASQQTSSALLYPAGK
jgi:hypothetical protein